MDFEERKRRMRRLVLSSQALSRALETGGFRSSFKGRGMDFDGLREYQVDDDALRIDWNATARLGRPYLKTYVDDRSLSVYLIVDESASMDYGPAGGKSSRAALAAALLAHACAGNGASVGALFFGGGALEHRAPAGGERAAMALSERALEGRRGDGRGSDLAGALTAAASYLKRRSLVVVVSDFFCRGYELPLAMAARRHDLAALVMRDADETAWLPRLLVRAVDAESGAPSLAFGRSAPYRRARERAGQSRRLELLAALAAAGAPYLELGADDDLALALVRFFSRPRRRA